MAPSSSFWAGSGIAQCPRGPGATLCRSCCWSSSWALSRSASTSSRRPAASLCRPRASGQAPKWETWCQGAQPGQGRLLRPRPSGFLRLHTGRVPPRACTLHPPAHRTCWWTGNGAVGGQRNRGVLDRSWEVAKRAKTRGPLNPLPSLALEALLASASGLVSMLKSAWNFILEVEREEGKAGPGSLILFCTPEILCWNYGFLVVTTAAAATITANTARQALS